MVKVVCKGIYTVQTMVFYGNIPPAATYQIPTGKGGNGDGWMVPSWYIVILGALLDQGLPFFT